MELDPSAEQAVPTQWATTRELMTHLHITDRNRVTRYIKEGMPVHRLNRRVLLFDLAEVDAWVRSRCIAPAPGGEAA